MASNIISMPNNWDCYMHQIPLWNFLDNGGKRAVCVWHRRAGKDSTVLNYEATEAVSEMGTYYHMLPTQRQAKKVIWDGIDRNGRRMIDQAFPKDIRSGINKQEMQIELRNGSMWQLCGSDNYDSLVGSNPKGVVFSEYPLSNPLAWNYIRPILAENNGWAVFIYTPRGKNHGWTLSEMARKNPNWFHSILNVEQTFRPDGTRIITPEAIQEERDAGMSEDMIQQEFYCSFDVAIQGAYFAQELASARADGRICFIPVDPMIDVHTFWDLGMSKGNSMVIWFVQAVGNEIRFINHYEAEGKGMPHFAQYLETFKKQHGINYGIHHAPWDINVRELTTGRKRIDVLRDMGLKFRLVQRTNNLNDSIERARRLFPRCWFDEKRCEYGISALASYHREQDGNKVDPEGNPVYRDQPAHDWASNSADAFRGVADAWSDKLKLHGRESFSKPVQAPMDFDVFDL